MRQWRRNREASSRHPAPQLASLRTVTTTCCEGWLARYAETMLRSRCEASMRSLPTATRHEQTASRRAFDMRRNLSPRLANCGSAKVIPAFERSRAIPASIGHALGCAPPGLYARFGWARDHRCRNRLQQILHSADGMSARIPRGSAARHSQADGELSVWKRGARNSAPLSHSHAPRIPSPRPERSTAAASQRTTLRRRIAAGDTA